MSLVFGKLSPLPRANVQWIVVHTEAAPGGKPGMPNHGTAESIHRYHRSQGWAGIGYHVVVEKDGGVKSGRPLDTVGAHVEGINSRSVGIVCTGNGDVADFNPDQRESLYRELHRLACHFNLDPSRIIGHQEINGLIERGLLPKSVPKTGKTCPGTKVDMREIRRKVAAMMGQSYKEPA